MPPGFPMRKDAEHAATASDIGFAVGGVLLAAGAVGLLHGAEGAVDDGNRRRARADGGGGGALLRATF